MKVSKVVIVGLLVGCGGAWGATIASAPQISRWLQQASPMVTECSINGYGVGYCAFTNAGWLASGHCVDLFVHRTDAVLWGGRHCSGRLEGYSRATVPVAVSGTSEFCSGAPSWQDVCTMRVQDADTPWGPRQQAAALGRSRQGVSP